MNRANSRLRGLLATLALVGFVIGVPVVLVVIDALPDPSAFTWSRLTSQDDGTLALQVITAVCWVAWAVFTCQLVASAVSQLRGIRTPRLPGLAVPQLAADRLVAAAALLFVAVPAVSAALPQPRAHAAVAAPLPDAPQVAVDIESSVAPRAEDRVQAVQPETERYTVKRGDSLWKIAEERLGDGTRYVELVALNEAVLGGRPDFLMPGTMLKIPVATASSDDSYIVQPGDTLSEIAEDHLGDADAYPSIFRASRDTVQPNGAHLSDPDLILPGWKMTLPSLPSQEPRADRHQERPPEVEPEATPELQPPVQTEPPPSAAPKTTDPERTLVDESDDAAPAWLLPGLAGAGAVLGAALWLVLRAQRRTQLRYRRPGTIIAPPPADLVPAEKTARLAASVVAPKIAALDSALRSLGSLPRLVTATLSDSRIELRLAEAAPLGTPWTGFGTEWHIDIDDVPGRPEDSFPPYPLLVSIGQDDDGSFTFLNLEELRTVTVTGDVHRKATFARHLAAELAVNSWSVVTRVDVLGLGSGLTSFNLGRVHTHPSGDTDFIAQMARELATATGGLAPDDFRTAVIATADRPDGDLADLAEVISSVPGRPAAALVDLGGEPELTCVHLDLGTDGRLRAKDLGLDVVAAGLSEEEAKACALLLDLTLDDEVIPIPEPVDEAAVSNAAGALVKRLTEARPDGPVGERSLLPLDAHVYADSAATTVEDVATVAPLARREATQEVQEADPTLDEDLALWESPGISTVKLTLLGPVGARTVGDAKTTAHRRPFYVELLAYLALHPKGATGSELAEAFGIQTDRVRVDVSQLRRWLGNDPRTGEPFLPKAEASNGPGSPAVYRLHGVLSDLDLFRRLRRRGQSRGDSGIVDLASALRLVSGEPFTNLREGHWNWLLDGDRWDHIMTSAIVDVGHIVTAHALAAGDRELAVWAAQVAYNAAPSDEVAQLDMIQAERAAGDDAGATRHLRDNVYNRRDDEHPPIDLPQRTSEVIRDKKWGAHGSRPQRTG